MFVSCCGMVFADVCAMVVYPASSKLRRKMNGRKEINVKSIDEIPN